MGCSITAALTSLAVSVSSASMAVLRIRPEPSDGIDEQFYEISLKISAMLTLCEIAPLRSQQTLRGTVGDPQPSLMEFTMSPTRGHLLWLQHSSTVLCQVDSSTLDGSLSFSWVFQLAERRESARSLALHEVLI